MGERTKAMVVSLGGTPAPIIFSLNQSKPEYICFFVSRDTKGIMDEVISSLNIRPKHHDWILTPNPESLSDSYSALRKKLPELFEKWEIDPQEVCVDYTGGTKTMSVALTLATIEESCCYSYVGGIERSKGGVGVVVDGTERMWFLDNPWDNIAHAEKREASILFNKARYASAADVLEKCVRRVSRDQQPFFRALREMVTGYDLWDRFRHADAKRQLHKCSDVLTALSSEKKEIKEIVKRLERNLQFLERLLSGSKPSSLYGHDLLANAKRRAELEKKFDDAVARLYRAIEVLAQSELKETYGIETSNVKEETIPFNIREEYLLKYKDRLDGKIKVPLLGSYRLLTELGSDLGKNFFGVYEKEIRPLLNIRNNSILAHGFNPVDQKTFERLFGALLKFSGTGEEDLPVFPVLKV